MAGGPRLTLTRAAVLAFRRRSGSLDERLPLGRPSLRRAAWAGLQDSMPRAASLSLHARVATTKPQTWEGPSLEQLWGPRFNVFVVARLDHAVFTLGLLPDDRDGRRRAHELAARVVDLLGDGSMPYDAVGAALGVHPYRLRAAAATGTVAIRWDGARCPTIRATAPPGRSPVDARLELARRFLHVYGPATAASFARWSGIGGRTATGVFESLGTELAPVRAAGANAWLLAADEEAARAPGGEPAAVRLLPSGDPYFLLYGGDREVLVPDAGQRAALWPSRVWPGALLVRGEIAGTWRRARRAVTVALWHRLSATGRDAVADEVSSLPLPGTEGPITMRIEG